MDRTVYRAGGEVGRFELDREAVYEPPQAAPRLGQPGGAVAEILAPGGLGAGREFLGAAPGQVLTAEPLWAFAECSASGKGPARTVGRPPEHR